MGDVDSWCFAEEVGRKFVELELFDLDCGIRKFAGAGGLSLNGALSLFWLLWSSLIGEFYLVVPPTLYQAH